MIQKIINLWEAEGTQSTCIDGTTTYTHPEYMYRKSGEWKGWSDFLDCPESPDSRYMDFIETMAFNILHSQN